MSSIIRLSTVSISVQKNTKSKTQQNPIACFQKQPGFPRRKRVFSYQKRVRGQFHTIWISQKAAIIKNNIGDSYNFVYKDLSTLSWGVIKIIVFTGEFISVLDYVIGYLLGFNLKQRNI